MLICSLNFLWLQTRDKYSSFLIIEKDDKLTNKTSDGTLPAYVETDDKLTDAVVMKE